MPLNLWPKKRFQHVRVGRRIGKYTIEILYKHKRDKGSFTINEMEDGDSRIVILSTGDPPELEVFSQGLIARFERAIADIVANCELDRRLR